MTPDRDQILSEFIDAWNAGRRPDVDDYITRVPASEQAELADELISFLSLAPTPEYTDADLEAIRAEPIVAESLIAASQRAGLLPGLMKSLRGRFSMSTREVAVGLVQELELPGEQADKTASYLDRLERGELEPARISRRVFEALSKLFAIPRDQLEGAGDLGRWGHATAAAAPVFRAEDEAAKHVTRHLEVLADALEAPGGEGRDEVDDLFLGGR